MHKANVPSLCQNSVKQQPLEKIIWTSQLVEKFWNGFAQTRLVELSFSRLAGKSLITAIDHLLPMSSKILDFGAGDGDLAKLLCARNLKVAAYEPSAERAQLLEAKMAGIDFLGIVNADSNAAFDVVLMIEVIEHILDEDLDDCLKHICSLMRPGGMLIVTTPNNEDLDLNMVYCPISNTLFHRWQHVRSFTQQSLVHLLQKFGLREIVTHQIEFNDAYFLKYDRIWGDLEAYSNPPAYIRDIRNNMAAIVGAGSNLLYVGRLAE